MAEDREVTFNHDVAGLIHRLERVRVEAIKAQSANLTGVIAADMSRSRSYLSYLLSFHAYVSSQPQLDLPESTPTEIELKPRMAMPNDGYIENPDMMDFIRLMDVVRVEMVNSTSSRQGSGLNPFDSRRFTDIIEKASRLLDHIEAATPIDLPESTPLHQDSGHGRQGINPR